MDALVSIESKAQSDIISALIIIIIVLTLVGTVYTWGLPLIQKRQDTTKVDRLYSYFSTDNPNSLTRKIEYIANNGGEETFSIDMDGIWILHTCPVGEGDNCLDTTDANNSLEFTTFSKVSNIGVNAGWISLSGSSCPPNVGDVGVDKPSAVCARADSLQEGFNLTYRIWFRELSESADKGYKINLVKHGSGPLSSTGRSVRISRKGLHTCPASECGRTLVITEIDILLE